MPNFVAPPRPEAVFGVFTTYGTELTPSSISPPQIGFQIKNYSGTRVIPPHALSVEMDRANQRYEVRLREAKLQNLSLYTILNGLEIRNVYFEGGAYSNYLMIELSRGGQIAVRHRHSWDGYPFDRRIELPSNRPMVVKKCLKNEKTWRLEDGNSVVIRCWGSFLRITSVPDWLLNDIYGGA